MLILSSSKGIGNVAARAFLIWAAEWLIFILVLFSVTFIQFLAVEDSEFSGIKILALVVGLSGLIWILRSDQMLRQGLARGGESGVSPCFLHSLNIDKVETCKIAGFLQSGLFRLNSKLRTDGARE